MGLFKKKKKESEPEKKEASDDKEPKDPIYESAIRLLTAEGWRRRMKKKN